jgi:hypothetical protein
MNTTNVLTKLMARYKPAPKTVITIGTKRGTTEQTQTERVVQPSTVLKRRPNADAVATIAELLDTFVSARGLTLNLDEGQTAADYIIETAVREGAIVIDKRDEKTGEPRTAWLRADAPVRKRRVKGDREKEVMAARTAALDDILDGELFADEDEDEDDADASTADEDQ